MSLGVPRNLRRRRSLRLTGRGVGALLVGAVAIAVAIPTDRRELLVVATAALLLVAAGVGFGLLRRPRLEIVRRFSPVIAVAGEPVEIDLVLHNRGRLPTPVLSWSDALPWWDDRAPATLPPVPGMRSRSVRYRATPDRRGHVAIGPFVGEYGDPFGMARTTVAVGGTDPLVVVPDLVDLTAGGPALADGDGVAQFAHRRALGTDDDLTTREYRAGDAMRRVHWRASARHGELMVRQEEQRSHPDVRVAIDTLLAGYPDAEPDAGDAWLPSASSDAFEWGVRMFASLAVHLDREGFTVGVEETGAPQLAPIGSRWEGRRRAESFLTSLAGVQLLEGEPHAAGEPRGPVFAIVAAPSDTTLDWVARRRDPADVGVVFVVDGGDRAARRLREAGWTVVPVTAATPLAAAWELAERADVDA